MDALEDLERRVALIECKAIALRTPDNLRVLGVLYDFAASPFNDGTLAMKVATIKNATGLDDEYILMALGRLKQATFVDALTTYDDWYITDEGRWSMQTAIALSEALLERGRR